MNNESTVVNENTNEKATNKLIKNLPLIFNITCVICSILMGACFLCGITEINGVNISIFASIDLVLSIFSLRFSMLYYYFTNIFCGVAYIVVAVFVIPNTIKIIVNFFKTLNKDGIIKKQAIVDMKSLYKQSFFYMLVFIAICRCFYSFDLSAFAIVIILCGIIVSLCDKITELLAQEDLTIESYINNFVYYAISLIILLILGKFLFTASIKEGLNGIKLLFSGVYTIGEQSTDFKFIVRNIVDTIAVPVFLFIQLVVYLDLFNKILNQKENDTKEIKKTWKRLFIFAIVVVVLLFIAETYLSITTGIGNNSFAVLSYLFVLIKNDQIIILMTALAGFVLCLFDLSYKKRPIETIDLEENKNLETEEVESPSENV